MRENEGLKLKNLVIFSEELFQCPVDNIDYQKITDNLLKISDAKYAAFIKYEKNTNSFFTTALSGISGYYNKACSILGFELEGKEWKFNPIMEERIRKHNITRFSAMHELIKDVFPKNPIVLLEKTFNIGETIIANIFRENVNLGYFVLVMPSGRTLQNEELIEVYTRQVGLLLERKKANDELQFQFKVHKMISETSTVFLSISDEEMDDAVDNALKACGKLFHVERAYIVLFSEDKKRISMRYEWVSEGSKPHRHIVQNMEISKNPWIKKTIMSFEYQHVTDTDELTEEADYEKEEWKNLSLKSILNIPLKRKKETIGFMGFNSHENMNEWSEDKIALLKVVAGIISNAFENKYEREQLIEREMQLNNAQRIGHIGSWELNLNSEKVYASEEAYRIYGYDYKQFFINDIKAATLPELRPMLDKALYELLELQKPYDVEYQIKRPSDGSICHLHSLAEYNPERNVITGTIQDVTERKEAEAKIAEKETWRRLLIESSIDGIVVVTTKGNVYEANQRYADMLGYTLEEVKQLKIWDWDANWTREQLLLMLSKVLYSPRYSETVHLRKDGKLINVEISANAALCGKDELIFCVCRDISDRKRAEEELQNRTDMLDMALEATCAGIWDLDLTSEKITLQGHDSWTKITGYTSDDFYDFNLNVWKHITHPDDLHEALEILQNAIKENKGFVSEYRMRHKNGQWIWVRAHGRISKYDATGKPLHIYGTHININEIKMAEEKAKKANNTKSEFLANISHEMRTPLNGIIGFSDLLLQTQLNDSQKHYMNIVNTSASLLLKLINDILDISKIEAGKLELNEEESDIIEICEQIIHLLKYRVHEKDLELLMNISPDLPQFAIVDALRLRQILVNLLGNALKFTEKGEIELKVEASGSPVKGEMDFTFSVRDTGIGIAKEKQSKIFDLFSQADGSITRKYGGTGLGLSISSKLLEKMGSKLELESREGKGSRFFFTIRLAVKEYKKADVEIPNSIKRVLIADDNINNCIILQNMLQAKDIETQIMTDIGNMEALLQSKGIYDLIIIDGHIGQMKESISKSNLLNKELNSEHIPVIIMENSTDYIPESSSCAKNPPCVSIIKPVSTTDLFDAISQLCSGKMKNNKNEDDKKETSSFISENRRHSILIAEDNETNLILASTIISKLMPEASILIAKDGNVAVNLYKEYGPDIVFMDIQMPELSGYDAATMIRELGNEGKYVPIIALTAGAAKSEKEKCIASGMDDYLTKPIISDNIKCILEKWLPADVIESKKPNNKDSIKAVHFDKELLLKNTEGDQELYNSLISLTMDSFIRNYDSMLASLKENNPDEIESKAHNIRGAALNIGFNIMAGLSEELEAIAKTNSQKIPELLEEIKEEIEILKSETGTAKFE